MDVWGKRRVLLFLPPRGAEEILRITSPSQTRFLGNEIHSVLAGGSTDTWSVCFTHLLPCKEIQNYPLPTYTKMIRRARVFTRENRPSVHWGQGFVAVIVLLEVSLGYCGRADFRPEIRPAPSPELLPIVDLIEPEGDIYDPKPEDLDVKVLRRTLGDDFDSKFMSEERPDELSSHPNGTFGYNLRKNKHGHLLPAGPMPGDLRHLRLNHVFLQDGGRVPLRLSRKMRRRFKELLWLVSYCPVLHYWKDLGLRFWPRWIRDGKCVHTSPTSHRSPGSCSIPGGMTCKPYRSVKKVLLRWHCQDWSHKSPCQWLSVLYPVITECRCSC